MLIFRYEKNLKLFLFWAFACILVNFFCTFGESYDGDQSFWVGWVQQLIDGGFGNFKGNYPPLYVFWLWVVAQIHSIFGIAVGKTFFLKFICLWPVYFAHLFLVDWLCRIVGKFGAPRWKQHLMIGFVALNPAILLNGPIWGQVDLVPVVLAMLSIYCISRQGLIKWASMFFVLSVLTKFQMIMFLPVFGGLFLRHWRVSWKGLPFAALSVVIVLLPFFIGGNLVEMLGRAYVQTSSQYPYATFNAANLWMLLAGNVAPDNVPIWGIKEAGLGFLLKPSVLGRVLFVAVSIFVLVKSLLCKNIRTAYALCTLNAVAFFVVLPGMHERYLMYAIPAALCWSIWDMKRGGIACVFVSLVASLNVNIINTYKGYDVWMITSALGAVVLVAILLVVAFPGLLKKTVGVVSRLSLPSFVPYVVLSVILLVECSVLMFQLRPVVVPANEKNVLVTDLPVLRADQSYKKPMVNESVEGRFLTSGDRLYKNGLGTHAPSHMTYELPENADSLFIGAGIDDEVYDHGSAVFMILLDGVNVWTSRVLQGRDRPTFVAIPVNGARKLELITDPDGDNNSDHTDWLNAYVRVR
jgi:Gpi18-like mannosyltransferase